MEIKEQVRLHMIEVKIDMTLQANELQLERLTEELATENDEGAKEVLKKWIAKYQDRIELLNSLKK